MIFPESGYWNRSIMDYLHDEEANTSNLSYTVQDGAMDDSDGYSLPQNIQIVLVCLYTTTILLSIGGNVLVCYVVFALQRLRNVTNFFIVNLSISDIAVTTLCIPFTMASNLIYYYWPFGSFLCPLVTYLQLITVIARALTLVAMTLDRHNAIWKPFNRRLSKSEAKFVIIMIWFITSVISLPTAINTQIQYLPYEPGSMGLCMEVWHNHSARYWYSILIILLQYFVPLTIMCVTYIHISLIIWAKKVPGEADNNRDIRMAASKRKIVKMLLVVVAVYAFSWLPLHVMTIVGDVNPSIYNFKYAHIIWLFSHWMAISNSFSNPAIYFCMNTAFHEGFLQVFRKFFCGNYSGFLRKSSPLMSGGSASSNKVRGSYNHRSSRRLINFARYD